MIILCVKRRGFDTHFLVDTKKWRVAFPTLPIEHTFGSSRICRKDDRILCEKDPFDILDIERRLFDGSQDIETRQRDRNPVSKCVDLTETLACRHKKW